MINPNIDSGAEDSPFKKFIDQCTSGELIECIATVEPETASSSDAGKPSMIFGGKLINPNYDAGGDDSPITKFLKQCSSGEILDCVAKTDSGGSLRGSDDDWAQKVADFFCNINRHCN